MKRKKSRKSRKDTKKWIIAVIIIVAIVAIGVVAGIVFSNKETPENGGNTPGGNEQPTRKKDEKITNFVIFGIDSRDEATPGDQYRSDMIMIISVNEDRDAIKMISILRDSKVPIEGYEPQKINAAYKYGGASLAIDTLNDNFHLKLRNYITVDFSMMVTLIEQIGGVDLELTQDEANIVNEQNPYEDPVKAGVCHLNGAQALSYSRIRSIDSDYDRASRQQNVMFAAMERLRSLGMDKSLEMLDTMMSSLESSYFYSDLYDIFSPLNMSSLALYRYTIPNGTVNPEVTGGLDETGSWVWQYDIEAAATYINKLLAWE